MWCKKKMNKSYRPELHRLLQRYKHASRTLLLSRRRRLSHLEPLNDFLLLFRRRSPFFCTRSLLCSRFLGRRNSSFVLGCLTSRRRSRCRRRRRRRRDTIRRPFRCGLCLGRLVRLGRLFSFDGLFRFSGSIRLGRCIYLCRCGGLARLAASLGATTWLASSRCRSRRWRWRSSQRRGMSRTRGDYDAARGIHSKTRIKDAHTDGAQATENPSAVQLHVCTCALNIWCCLLFKSPFF